MKNRFYFYPFDISVTPEITFCYPCEKLCYQYLSAFITDDICQQLLTDIWEFFLISIFKNIISQKVVLGYIIGEHKGLCVTCFVLAKNKQLQSYVTKPLHRNKMEDECNKK